MATTVRQVYEGINIEINKVEAPSLLLSDYVYFINKSIQDIINQRYQAFETTQQITDDLQVLKRAVVIPGVSFQKDSFNTFIATLPTDYLHLTSCKVKFLISTPFKCYKTGDEEVITAKKETDDSSAYSENNAFLRPNYRRVYYSVLGNSQATVQTNTIKGIPIPSVVSVGINTPGTTNWETSFNRTSGSITANKVVQNFTDGTRREVFLFDVLVLGIPTYKVSIVDYYTASNILQYSTYNATEILTGNLINATTGNLTNIQLTGAFANAIQTVLSTGSNGQVNLRINYGKDHSVFILKEVYVTYLKTPLYMNLTAEDLDSTIDNSQVMEFPDYVCQQIINRACQLILENMSDPRVQTTVALNPPLPNQ